MSYSVFKGEMMMKDIFVNNIKIFSILITIYIIYKIILSPIYNEFKLRIALRWKNNRISKLNYVNEILHIILITSLLISLVTLQQKFHFIDLGKEDNYINLVISVLTLYGIFYAFIQFAIGYASQIERDKYWGESKTKAILTRNIGYKFFGSNTFKLLLSIGSLYPVIKLNKELLLHFSQITFIDLSVIKNFAVSFWEVSIFSIFILYIILFTKSLLIMQWFFHIQERKDFMISHMIKNDILKMYQDLFIESYRKRDYYFFRRLVSHINTVKPEEKAEMLHEVIKNSINRFIDIQVEHKRVIESGNKISKKVIDEHRYRSHDLINFFNDLWKYIQEDQIALDFKTLLYLYELQNSVLLNQIFIFCLGNEQRIINGINSTFIRNDHLRNSCFEENSFYDIPEIIWNKITTYRELTRLNHYMIDRSATENLLERYNNAEMQKFSEEEKIVLDEYRAYLDRILYKCNEFQEELKRDDSLYLFRSYSNIQGNRKISSAIQEHIFHYICDLKYSEENKKYIEILTTKLDYKYIIAFIFYIMFYMGSDSYSQWQKDILFLRKIAHNYYDSENIKSKEDITYICSLISNIKIGRRISSELIIWTLHHLNSDISESILKRCNNDRYLSYAKYLKLKFIFHDYGYFYPRFYELSLDSLDGNEWSDWRVGFLEEIIQTPNILKEEFFSIHQYRFYEEVLKSDLPESLYERNDFRLFFINHSFFVSENDFITLIRKDTYFGKGIFEFLILNLDEEKYSYLMENYEISVLFKKKVKEIMNIINLSIVEYVHNLVNMADECSNAPFSIFKKERIIKKLQELLY